MIILICMLGWGSALIVETSMRPTTVLPPWKKATTKPTSTSKTRFLTALKPVLSSECSATSSKRKESKMPKPEAEAQVANTAEADPTQPTSTLEELPLTAQMFQSWSSRWPIWGEICMAWKMKMKSWKELWEKWLMTIPDNWSFEMRPSTDLKWPRLNRIQGLYSKKLMTSSTKIGFSEIKTKKLRHSTRMKLNA